MIWLIPLIIGYVLLIPFLYLRIKELRLLAVIIKGIVSLLFITTALVAWQNSKHSDNLFGLYIIIALFFGLCGDILLDLKYMSRKKELIFTISGFFAFALGHAFYLTGLFTEFYNFDANIMYIIVPVIITLLLTLATLGMELFTPIKYGKMRLYVLIYGLFLFFTTSIYISFAIYTNWQITTINIMAISFLFFTLSDLVLNNTYFAPGFNKPVYIIVNHLLYYIAQFSIAFSLFYLL